MKYAHSSDILYSVPPPTSVPHFQGLNTGRGNVNTDSTHGYKEAECLKFPSMHLACSLLSSRVNRENCEQ